MGLKVGVARFLGTNCDLDVWNAIKELEMSPEWLWFKDRFNVNDYKAIIIPGGFSYGDYLRSGALAAKSPVMDSIREAAQKGVPLLGICNGFQILCESHLLPGALVKNKNLKFIDRWVGLEQVTANPYWGGIISEIVDLPVAHGDGRYVIDSDKLKELEDKEQVWLRYSKDINGSLNNIAGVMSGSKKVAGLMPHPERALYDWTGGQGGRAFFKSLMEAQL